ncbi:hypothetical protein NXS98_00770 [Fontisphaera persica]|uniref:hypothetical protein n=1 Tax=Fontisphaera persica TaxID=2974023 RepID=UPI0024BFDA89|nr:hypothetical protein [Fontisphaera persica]WCJ59682.1 hypothetical protein NXS98_00770 [Fontisphaera persica]
MQIINQLLIKCRIYVGFILRKTGLKKDPFYYLRFSKGVIHIGAHKGQEAGLYAEYNLPVLWIEAVEEYFVELRKNIQRFPNQIAINAMLGSEDGKEQDFYIGDTLSSMYPIDRLKELLNTDGEFTQRVLKSKN